MYAFVMSLLRVCAAFILVGQFVSLASAQEADSRASVPPYPGGSKMTFEWSYSCPGGRRCSFDCPGRGGAGHVTKLTIFLGTVPFGSQDTPSIFYEFATAEIPRGSGFTISAGLSTLSCQVNGMTLDYSGPPRSQALSERNSAEK
jgi:hypothetical protein